MKYAFICVVDTGVRLPHVTSTPSAVPFIVMLEPLYLGAIPSSLTPMVVFFFLSLAWGFVTIVLPSIHAAIGKNLALARVQSREAAKKKQGQVGWLLVPRHEDDLLLGQKMKRTVPKGIVKKDEGKHSNHAAVDPVRCAFVNEYSEGEQDGALRKASFWKINTF